MNSAIILAGGSGQRFGEDKALFEVNGKELVRYSLETFSKSLLVDNIFLVTSEENHQALEKIACDYPKVMGVTTGGRTRFLSAKAGYLEAKKWGTELVIFHNVANPLLSLEDIDGIIKAGKENKAATVARKVTATIRHENNGVLDREKLWEMETPQAILAEVFEEAMDKITDDKSITDDVILAEKLGIKPKLVETSSQNRKITKKSDLNLLFPNSRKIITSIGQDSHKFDDSGELVLGGVIIPEAPKLKGNSDGDALLHAVCNAISSALGMGSLSTFADLMCQEGISDSSKYLEFILQKLKKASGQIEYISISIEAKKPKLEKILPKMRARLAKICDISENFIGITVSTGEELTACGRGEGILVFVVTTLSF